jgi:gluconate:H+ symporter, GntP family
MVQILISMLAGIAVIIFCTTKLRLPAFFALLIACFVTGLGVQLSLPAIITITKTGFGNILQSLGFIIILGTTLGVLLEQTGSTRVMAEYILRKVGEKNASLAISITGFIVGMPVFCDSGYIVLSGLNKSMTQKTGISPITMSVSLASGLYAVHCLLPPHPGAAAAAGTIGVDFGKLILYGLIVAIPVMLVGHAWSIYAGKKWLQASAETNDEIVEMATGPSVINAFLPVIVPIILITIRSFFVNDVELAGWIKDLLVIGDPVIALLIAVLLAFAVQRNWTRPLISKLLHESLEKAGGILLIIGAGGAFGAVLAATKIGDHFASMPFLSSMGLLFPFLLTVILKTAQGSSTVAIITAASIMLPLLSLMGFDTEMGRLLVVLAMGAGSMMISHANDAYFWVIAKFSGIEMKPMLKAYSTASILMGLTGFVVVWLLSLLVG